MKILIVDDTPVNLRLLRAMLEGQQHEVVEASNGLEGLAMLENEHCDAVISDILMPDMDGYRFCSAVRRHKRFHNIPFIFYTSTYTSLKDEKLAYDVGADKYLKKPAPVLALLTALHHAVSIPRRAINEVTVNDPGVLKEYSQVLVAKLEAKCAELQLAVDRYDDLFDNAHDLIQSVRPDGRFLYVNRTWHETLGYKPEELPRLKILDTIHPVSRPQFTGVLERLLAGERMNRIETTFISKGGEGIMVDGSASCRIAEGKTSAMRCIFRNVTERKRAEAALEERSDHLQAVFQRAVVAQVATGVSGDDD